MITRRLLVLLIISILFSLCVLCSESGMIAGATDTETGGTTVVGCIMKNDGTPASNTIVTLIPNDYNPAKVDSAMDLLTDTTNAFGYYQINTSVKGMFNIQAYNAKSSNRTLLYGINCNDSVALAPMGVLSTPGCLRLSLPNSDEFINETYFIPGTQFFSLLKAEADYIVIDSIPEGIVPNIQYAEDSGSTILRNSIPIISGDTTIVYNPEWQYCRQVFLNTSESGAHVEGDVVQFPVIIRLDADNFDFSQAQTDGADIRFTKRDNMFLPYEIEYWNADEQVARIWVRIDTIYGNNGTQSIVMYWGNHDAVDVSSGAEVFDTAVGFQGVWHLTENGNDTARDVTSNHFDGIAYDMAGSVPVPGPLGNGRAFDGYSSYITMPNTADGKLNFPESGFFSVSAWVYTDTLDNRYGSIVGKGLRQYGLWLSYFPLNNPKWEFFNFHKTYNWNLSGSPATGRQWVLITGVRSGKYQYLYCNGELVADKDAVYPYGLLRDTANDLTIGRFLKEAVYPLRLGHCFFRGSIEEVRICNVARSADWERLSYMNQRRDDKLVQYMPPTSAPLK